MALSLMENGMNHPIRMTLEMVMSSPSPLPRSSWRVIRLYELRKVSDARESNGRKPWESDEEHQASWSVGTQKDCRSPFIQYCLDGNSYTDLSFIVGRMRQASECTVDHKYGVLKDSFGGI
jgi:hypothetical protein